MKLKLRKAKPAGGLKLRKARSSRSTPSDVPTPSKVMEAREGLKDSSTWYVNDGMEYKYHGRTLYVRNKVKEGEETPVIEVAVWRPTTRTRQGGLSNYEAIQAITTLSEFINIIHQAME